LAVVGIDGSQQGAQLHRVRDRSVVRRRPWSQRSNKVRGDIVLGATRRNRVTEDTSADLPGAVRGIYDAFGFDALQDLKQVRSLNRSNRFAPKVGNHSLVNLLPIASPRRFRERRLLRQEPFVSDGKKVLV
jgi:hypothetical protein